MRTNQVRKARSKGELDAIVDESLGMEGEAFKSTGETYTETAERIREDKPRLAEILDAAEVRWFELCN